ncbi:hypothetical protein AX16_004697 [Volvariella volvacea WC 439]|nr:hypothetical protein AX16_004697 [Volvariella volvacea WC 439]
MTFESKEGIAKLVAEVVLKIGPSLPAAARQEAGPVPVVASGITSLSLSPELLQHIFSYALGPLSWSENHPYLGHIAVTSVCRYWRSVAIAYGPLWATIVPPYNSRTTTWISELIQRSQDYPLSVIFGTYKFVDLRDKLHCFNFVLSQIHRIRSLDIDIGDYSFDSTLLSSLSTPAPLLRYLRLYGCNFSDDSLVPLFQNSIPLLTRLTIGECGINYDNFPFQTLPQLTKLILEDNRTGGSTSGLVRFLQAIPNLQHLEFRYSPPCGDDPVPTPVNLIPIPLNSLTSLIIFEGVEDLGDFLPRIAVNPRTKIEIELDLHGGIALFSERGPDRHHQPDWFKFCLERNRYMRKAPDVDAFLPVASNLISSLPLDHLRRLTLSVFEMSEDQWRNALNCIERLEVMVLKQGPEATSLEALFYALSASPVLLPSWNALALDIPFDLMNMDAAFHCLGKRREMGFPLQSLFVVREEDTGLSYPSDEVAYYAIRCAKIELQYSIASRCNWHDLL